MQVEKIKMPKEQAKEEWKRYNDLIKTRHEKYLKDMKDCMYQLKQGRDLIDIYKVMESAGLNKKHEPRLAITRADWKQVFFRKKDSGRGFFSGTDTSWHTKSDGHVDLQPEIFMHWPRKLNSDGKPIQDSWGIANELIKTKVPVVPAQLMPEGDLKNYYILWEVKEWETVPEKDDPILLKRITENLFVILAAWDVTDLEQSIIRGR